MSRIIIALALLGSAAADSISQRFGNNSHALYGVKAENADVLAEALRSGTAQLVPTISAEQAAALPEAFDSAANWPECAKVINDIRDQSNCGCCWAFGAASAASDRACIASGGAILAPFSAQDVCFNAQRQGCNGGSVFTPWKYISKTGVVTGGQNLEDLADPKSDPFDGDGYCAAYSLPHCHHHGDVPDDPYPDEGAAGCPSVTRSPAGPTACDDSSEVEDFAGDRYTFDGRVHAFPIDAATIMAGIMADGPVEAAFTVYSDFEEYVSGIYEQTSTQNLGGHAIRLVGWGTEDGVDYWKVANSWNPYWGEEGYFRIVRGRNECGIEASVVASAAGASWGKVSAMRAL